MLHPGQLVSRISRRRDKPDQDNYSQIMQILPNTFQLPVIFVMTAITINALTLLNTFIMRQKCMPIPGR